MRTIRFFWNPSFLSDFVPTDILLLVVINEIQYCTFGMKWALLFHWYHFIMSATAVSFIFLLFGVFLENNSRSFELLSMFTWGSWHLQKTLRGGHLQKTLRSSSENTEVIFRKHWEVVHFLLDMSTNSFTKRFIWYDQEVRHNINKKALLQRQQMDRFGILHKEISNLDRWKRTFAWFPLIFKEFEYRMVR